MKKLKKYFKKFKFIRNLLFLKNRFYYVHYLRFYSKFVSKETILKKLVRKKLNRELNLENPTLFNDKLQWLKLYGDYSLARVYADKYRVRKYIAEAIGEEHLIELYGVYDSVEEININELPKSFVLKATHGSGFNIICEDKDKVDWNKAKKNMKYWLDRDYYLSSLEPVYENVKPKIFAEKYLEQDGADELRDYRIFCFHGEPKFVAIDLSITNKNKTRRNLYDLDWKLMDATISYPREESVELKRPENLDKMLEFSRKLSKPFVHARIDFYNVNNRIIFSEITFFHQSGTGRIKPLEFEKKMGDWIKLPSKKRRRNENFNNWSSRFYRISLIK